MTAVEPGSAWSVGELCETIVSSKRLVVFIDFVGSGGKMDCILPDWGMVRPS